VADGATVDLSSPPPSSASSLSRPAPHPRSPWPSLLPAPQMPTLCPRQRYAVRLRMWVYSVLCLYPAGHVSFRFFV